MGACGSKAAVRGEAVVAVSGRAAPRLLPLPPPPPHRIVIPPLLRQTLSSSAIPQAAVSPDFAKGVKGGTITPQTAPSSSDGEALSSKPAESVVTDPVRVAAFRLLLALRPAGTWPPDCMARSQIVGAAWSECPAAVGPCFAASSRQCMAILPAQPRGEHCAASRHWLCPSATPFPAALHPPGSRVHVHTAQVMMFDCRGFEVEQQRESAVKALGLVDTPVDDPRFNAITK